MNKPDRDERPAGSPACQMEGSSENKPTVRSTPFPVADVPWTLRDVAWATVIFGFIFGSFAATLLVLHRVQESLQIQGNPYMSGVLILILETALVFPVWLFTLRKYGAGWQDLGFRSFEWPIGCGFAVLFLMSSFVINAMWAGLLALFDLRVQPDILPVFGGGVAGLTVAWLAAGVAAPLVEETFFRGFLLPTLAQRYKFWTAALIDGLVFAFIHFTPTALVPLFVLGVLLCVLYRITNSIWPSIMMHAIMNTLAVSAAYAVEIGAVPTPGT